MKNKVLLPALFLLFAVQVHASVEITEILYDHEGTDTKKEWVEVYNNSDSAIDLTSYRFREADTNHAIKMYGSSGSVPARGYAVIADSPVDVESELAGALIFDSAFSLSNSGEELSVINPGGTTDDVVLYDVSLGAKGDGKSLQKIDGAWVPATPTPGAENKPSSDSVVDLEIVDDTESVQTTESSADSGKTKSKAFYLEVTIPKTIFVGENVFFKAKTFDGDDNDLKYSNYSWSFGDGGFSTEANPAHIYNTVGDYIVYTEASSGDYVETNKARIHVYEKPLAISSFTKNNLVIKNNSSSEVDIGGWSIMSNGLFYVFPKHTYMLGKGVLSISLGITGLSFDHNTVLTSPSGGIIGMVDTVAITQDSKVKTTQSTLTSRAQQKPIEASKTTDNKALQASVAGAATQGGGWIWISIFGLVLALGLGLLYFLQKRHTLIDEIEIIE